MPDPRKFDEILQDALAKTGGKQAWQSSLPAVRSNTDLERITDAEYLSLICRRVFQAGMTHRVVNARWPHFEKVFWGFEPEKLVLIGDDLLEQFMQDEKLIRHWTKMKTIPVNAQSMLEVTQSRSFGSILAEWPEEDIAGLWQWLRKHFARMGGRSGAALLRTVGKDTFILTNDTLLGLKRYGGFEGKAQSQQELNIVSGLFNTWHEQSGLPLAHISKTLALAVSE